MEDFEEIAHTGGVLSLGPSGYGVSHHTDKPVKIFQIAVSLSDGGIVQIPFGGIGAQPQIPPGSVPVLMISDSEGYYGRTCPTCNEYFRTDSIPESMYCPYCEHLDNSISFFTENQLEYIQSYLNAFINAMKQGMDVEINLDHLIDNLHENKSAFVYSDLRQQTHVKCECNVSFEILGQYGSCPKCKKRNSLTVIERKLLSYEERINNPRFSKEERIERENEWIDIVKNCISDFEALADDIRTRFLVIPATPKRKKQVSDINFQNVTNAHNKLLCYFEIDIFNNISEQDRCFLHVWFNRRHLFTHKAGIVDQDYIEITSDTSVRIRQKLRVRSAEVKRLVTLTGILARNLFEGYESFS